MIKFLACSVLSAVALVSAAVASQQIKLKVSFYSSDRSITYLSSVKPFVDAVDQALGSEVAFEVGFSGALGPIRQQPQLVLDGGGVDIALALPGYTPELFPDNVVMEMPGLFRNALEASLVYTRLVAAGALRGYENYVVLGAYASPPESIHSRVPIASLADLGGKRIRVNNPGQAAALKALGAVPVQMAITEITQALSSGSIDAALVPLGPLQDFGIKRLATNHYLLPVSHTPMALLMNRRRFETLPESVQVVLRKYAGAWAAERFVEARERDDKKVLDELLADTKRRVIEPTASDQQAADAAFHLVTQQMIDKRPATGPLLNAVKQELAEVREMLKGSQP